jgi:hypothetical protein
VAPSVAADRFGRAVDSSGVAADGERHSRPSRAIFACSSLERDAVPNQTCGLRPLSWLCLTALGEARSMRRSIYLRRPHLGATLSTLPFFDPDTFTPILSVAVVPLELSTAIARSHNVPRLLLRPGVATVI